MNLFRKKSAPVVNPVPARDRVPAGLVTLTKTAGVSLEKAGLEQQRAAVQLVLDHSGSMSPFYEDGSVQRLAEQALALSVHLDDDGQVPLTYFGSREISVGDIDLDGYEGVIARTHRRVPWGSTDYVAGMKEAVEQHGHSTRPGLVIFQTDGNPDDRSATESYLRTTSRDEAIFWAFVGFGRNTQFLRGLDDLAGRAVDNAAFIDAADPWALSDDDLYDAIVQPFREWLRAATAAGIVR
ncbi:VWA domain-containing protein [Streptomyces sp. NPDC059605]|uniref:VWA domain-containing protein n=1 Tax=Streptomyces sp. NPDC059605 TaxID=3346882 RepID=UPI0036CC3C30